MLSALLTECLASSLLAVIHHFIRKSQGNAPPEWLALSSSITPSLLDLAPAHTTLFVP